MILGNNIKKLRLHGGYKQKDIAKFLGVSVSTISCWEKGKKLPYGKNLKKLIDFFGVSETEIFSNNIDKVIEKQNFIDFPYRKIKIKEGIFLVIDSTISISKEAILIKKAEKMLKILFE